MFGHLRAEDFVNAIDDAPLAEERRRHLGTCATCADKLHEIRTLHASIAAEDSGIPEPEWHTFRESVRSGLLSRSVQRDSALRRWTGWPVRPALAWGLSLVLLICVSAGGFLWHVSQDVRLDSETSMTLPVTTTDSADMDSEIAAWGQSGVFEDLAEIQGPQAEKVRQILQAAVDQEKPEQQ